MRRGPEVRRRLTTSTLIVLAMTVACDQQMEFGKGTDQVVRDSLGVKIFEGSESFGGAWQASPDPIFALGWGDAGPAFTWLQSGWIRPDGGALVGEFGAGAIYRVAPDGSVLGTWGRKGEGPGEYQGLDAIVAGGDSILVSDGRLRRLTILSPDGEVQSTRLLAGSLLHQVSTILSDGRLLLIPGSGYSSVAETRPEWVFETQPIIATDVSDGTIDTLAVLPHLRRWYGTRGGSPGPINVSGRAGGFLGGFAWARADEAEVRWYDGSGQLVQVIRWRHEPVELTSELKRRMVRSIGDAYRSVATEEPIVAARLAEFEEGLDRFEGPLPYWEDFAVDREGNAWLQEYALPGESSDRWRIVTRDGTFNGWVDLPDVISILDISGDRILVVRLNELDVPAVVMIGIIKP